MALPIWGILGGVTALFFAALFLRRQKMLELAPGWMIAR